MDRSVEIYDTTLRDGAQQPGISFSAHDKILIARRLDQFGVHYIELGWPGSNKKDSEVFAAARNMEFTHAKIAAFGMTCAKGKNPRKDEQLAALLSAETDVITIVGKASLSQVEKVLHMSGEDYLSLVRDTCSYLADCGRTVFFDAEHFFAGYRQNSEYALSVLLAAIDSGAGKIILCDTDGGSIPSDVCIIVKEVRKELKCLSAMIGIHAHNDGELAVANSIAAVEGGAGHIQGTINGIGERCGNTNLCSLIPALALKMHLDSTPDETLQHLSELAHFVAETANLQLNHSAPYVGRNAFRHKAGLHVNAISKDEESYHHVNPARVGNRPSVEVSELSGKSTIKKKAEEFGIKLTAEEAVRILARVESLEHIGFQFGAAEASLEVMMKRYRPGYVPPFIILRRDVSSSRQTDRTPVNEATVKVEIHNAQRSVEHNVSEGDGAFNALDLALRKSIVPHFPCLSRVWLVDYKVRVLDGEKGTAKSVRVLIDFSDGENDWTTVGCSTDATEASLMALADGYEYAILKA